MLSDDAAARISGYRFDGWSISKSWMGIMLKVSSEEVVGGGGCGGALGFPRVGFSLRRRFIAFSLLLFKVASK